MPDFQNIFFLRLLLTLISLGSLVSLVSSLIAGAYFSTILWRLFLTCLSMALVSVSLYSVLHYFAPEILEALEEPITNTALEENQEESEKPAFDFDEKAKEANFPENPPHNPSQEVNPNFGKDIKIPRKNQNLGDELIVEGVRIPNNPALMADAIRDTLEKDRE